MSDEDLKNMKIEINGKPTSCLCGVIHQKTGDRKGYWHFVNGKYFFDFKEAIRKYLDELEREISPDLSRNFYARAKQINLKRFD